MDVWIGQFEEGYWPTLANLGSLTERVGELARLLNHRCGPKTKKPNEAEQDLGEELADVLFALIVLANQQGVDLGSSLERVREKHRARDSARWAPEQDRG